MLGHLTHRDKARLQMTAKMFPHLKLICIGTIFEATSMTNFNETPSAKTILL
jgi:hypothetical protein